MTYVQIDDKTPEGKKIVEFLKTQRYIKILNTPNQVTKQAILAARNRDTKKAKNVKDMLS